MLSLILLLILSAGVHWGRPAWQRAELMYWQHQCLAYQTPAMVVFEEDPTAAASLLKSGKGYLPTLGLPPPQAMYVPHCFTAYAKATALPLPSEPVLFLHQRVSPHGLVRIVAVQCDPGWRPELTLTNYFDNWAIEPSSFTKTPASWNLLQGPRMKMGPMGSRRPGDPYLRFFAGQADPSDASHFTIAYQMTAGAGTIDGWLRDSGAIDLKIRDGPPVEQAKINAAYQAADDEFNKMDAPPAGITVLRQRAITVAAYEKAVAVTPPGDPAAPRFLMKIAELLDNSAFAPPDFDQALAVYERLARKYPDFAIEAACGQASIYWDKDDAKHCREQWHRVLDLPMPSGSDPKTVAEQKDMKSFAVKFLAGLDHRDRIRASTKPAAVQQ